MNTNKQTVQTAVQPERQLQPVAQTKEPEVPTLRRTIGGTTYMVRIHFSQTSKEALADNVKKLMMEEVRNG